jgi:hypothetical protein
MDNAKLIILVRYGSESKTFISARLVWERLLRQYDNVEIYFSSASEASEHEWLEKKNTDLISHVQCDRNLQSRYEETAQWSEAQLITQLKRELIAFEYLYRSQPKPFWVFLTTVTSIISINRLVSFISTKKCENFLAANLFSGFNTTVMSGAGTLISSDLIGLVLQRQHEIPLNFYSDVWLSLTLKDIPRINLQRIDFTEAEGFDLNTLNFVAAKTLDGLSTGHFHFRVKSNKLIGNGRENVDPKILHTILNVIVACD